MSRHIRFTCLVFAVTVALASFAFAADAAKGPSAPASAPRLDKWIVIGPGGGGAQYDPVVSPHDNNVVMARCDMTGTYISHDCGDSWRMFNMRGGSRFYIFDPNDPSIIYVGMYVGGSALLRSTDAGKTWNLIFPSPSNVQEVVGYSDHSDEKIVTIDGSTDGVSCMAVDPADSKILYAVMATKDRAWLAVSTNFAKSWQPERDLPMGCTGIYIDPRSPKADRTVYVLAPSGTLVRKSGKWTDNAAPEGVTSFSATAAGWPGDGGELIIYGIVSPSFGARGGGQPGAQPAAPTQPGLHVSTDGGTTWTSVTKNVVGDLAPSALPEPTFAFEGRMGSTASDLGGERRRGGSTDSALGAGGGMGGGMGGGQGMSSTESALRAQGRRFMRGPRLGPLTVCLTQGNVAVMQVSGIPQGADKPNFSGIARTEDCGKTWKLLVDDTPHKTYSPDLRLPWMYELYTPGYGAGFTTMGMSPTDPMLVFGTDLGRTMRSRDGGRTWKECYCKFVADETVTTRGLDVTTCYGIHFDPFDANRLYISYTDIGGFLSEDGGTSWRIATDGVPRSWRNTTYWVEYDPQVKGRVYGVFCGPHDLPRPKMWRGRGGLSFSGGFCVSNDGGLTWENSSEGMPPSGGCTHLIIDPTSRPDARTIYVAGMGNGVFKSTDSGKTWTLKKNGIEGERPLAWRLARDSKGVLYCVVARRSEDGSIGNDGDGALYRSTDGAETWTKVALPEGTNGPNGLAIDPQDSNRLYLAMWCRASDENPGGGIFLSTDAGKTWKNVLDRDRHIYDITVDPRNPKTLYACGFESSAWRSDDAGETWRRLKGFNFKWGHRVIPDPHNPDMIFVTTFGGSVWYGPAQGDPNATDDIVTPELSVQEK